MKTPELNELLKEIRSGSDDAFEVLLETYRPLVDSMADKYMRGCDAVTGESQEQELRQDARLALYKAALTYDLGSDSVSFGLYAKICIRNALVSEIRKIKSADRRRRKAMDSARTADTDGDPSRDRAVLLNAVNSGKCGLSEYEKSVFLMLLDGKTVAQIAEITGNDAKSVSNAVFRAKRKVRSII